MNKETRQLLYTFEHAWLPQLFFRQREVLTDALIKGDSSMLSRILSNLAGEVGVPCPFTEDDFPVQVEGYPIDRYVVKVTFPEPEQAPMCHFACLCFDKGLTGLMYLTVEKSEETDGDVRPFLCSWSADDQHTNYGPCELEEAFDRCVGLYLGEYHVKRLEEPEG